MIDEKKADGTTSSSSSSSPSGSSSGTAMTNGPEIGEKRDEKELQAEETGTTKIRRIQTVTGTSITSVEKISTKRGKEVEIKVNEDDELRLSDPLLGAEQFAH